MSSSARSGTRTIIPPMERRVRQVWMVLHIVSSVGWTGTVFVAIALCVAGMESDDLDHVKALYEAMSVLAEVFFIPGTLLLLLTGIVLGLGTKWGLFKWWWVTVKLVIGIVLFVAGLVGLRSGVSAAAAQTGRLEPLGSSALSLVGMFSVITLLALFSALLSVLKPWGRIRRRTPAVPARREAQESTL